MNALCTRLPRASRARLCAAAAVLALAAPAFALRDIDPTDPTDTFDPPVPVVVSGSLTFRGCTPAASDVSVRTVLPARTAQPSSAVMLTDGSIRMNYTLVIGHDGDANLPAQVTVTPRVAASACGSASFSPGSRQVAPGTTAVNFDYQALTTGTFMIPADAFTRDAGAFLNQTSLRLHNDGSQGSFITLDGMTTTFDIAPVSKDLPGPTGTGRFFVRDMHKNGASMTRSGSLFNAQLRFEQSGIEVKGHHSWLGDQAMPDFHMSNPSLNVTAGLRVRGGQLLLVFTSATLSAGITSTVGCNVFDVDWCNFLFGTSGKVKTAFQRAALTQLQSSTIQNAVKARLAAALASRGITGTIGTARVIGDQIVITTIANTPPCTLPWCTVDWGNIGTIGFSLQ